MGRPKGSVNKPKLAADGSTVVKPVHVPKTAGSPGRITLSKVNQEPVDASSDTEDNTDDAKINTSSVKLVDKKGCWGIIYGNNHNYVTLVRREFYEVDTEVNMRRWGMKTFPAGTYGKWQIPNALFPANDSQALDIVAKAIYQEHMEEAKDLRDAAATMRAVWAGLKESFFS